MLIKSGPLNLEISHLIGEGAFGKVYLAKDLSSNQKYAIKIVETSKMSQKAQELFNNEKKILRIATANNFRNIIKINYATIPNVSPRIIKIVCNQGAALLTSCNYFFVFFRFFFVFVPFKYFIHFIYFCLIFYLVGIESHYFN